jgi:transposase
MTETEMYEQRKTAIHLLRGGMSVSEVARELERSVSWVQGGPAIYRGTSRASQTEEEKAQSHTQYLQH